MTEKKTRSSRSVAKPATVRVPQTPDQRLGEIVKALEKQPGVTILSVGSQPPRAANPHRVAQGRSILVRYDPRWTELRQGGKAEFEEYGYISAGPYGTDVYHGSNRFFREYRKNFLIAGCIDALAFWSSKEGFDTVLEPKGIKFSEDDAGKAAKAAYLEKYAGLKEWIDQQNENVELDSQIPIAITMAKIFGHHGFEYDDDGEEFTRWVSLDPDQIQPVNNRRKERMGYSYRGRGTTVAAPFYQPDEVFYLCNKDLDGRGYGLSDIEPVLKEIQLDDKVVREDLTEAATTLWAGQILLWLDIDRIPTSWTDADIQRALDNQVAAMLPGKTVASDNRFTAQIVDLKPDTDKLVNISDKMERRILGNFKVPRFMLNIEAELNRATAYAELEAFVDGPITATQRWLKRALERQWYLKLTKLWLSQNDPSWTEKKPLPICVKHVWRQIRTSDTYDMIHAAAEMFAQGSGFGDQEKAYEFMQKGGATDWDPKQLEVNRSAIIAAIKQFPTKELKGTPAS